MTDSAQQVRVEQVDREAATQADVSRCFASYDQLCRYGGANDRSRVDRLAVAFARHRLAALASATPPDRADLIARIDAETEGLVTPNDRGQLLLDCRAALASVAQAGVMGDLEDAAWSWLESKWLSIEAGDDPNDRDYCADEMVDAFIAGRESAAHPSPAQGEAKVSAIEAMREALLACRDVLYARIPRLGPEGPNSEEEQREYEDVGGAWSMADRALRALPAAEGAQTGWRDIATAPFERWVLIAIADPILNDDTVIEALQYREVGWMCFGANGGRKVAPLAWMPKPTAPTPSIAKDS